MLSHKEQAIKKNTLHSPLATRHRAITPYTATLCLAYIHHYTPKRLPGRRFLAANDVCRLSQWLGYPASAYRTLRQCPLLAAHLVVLNAANLLKISATALSLTPQAQSWLHLAPAQQTQQLLECWQSDAGQQPIITQLGLENIIRLDYATFIEQSLTRQQNEPALGNDPTTAVWQEATASEEWQLCLPPALPTWLLFDLLHLGEWQPNEPLRCTPLSLATPSARPYEYDHLCWLFETATGQPLSPAKRSQLRQWLRRRQAYVIHDFLLTTAQPEQLRAIRQRPQLRQHLLQQIGPRHALVSQTLIPPLRRWLAQQGYPLHVAAASPVSAQLPDDLEYHWLGLRLLVGLHKWLSLPYATPTAQLGQLSQQLPPEKMAELELLAEKSLASLNDVIAGRDAFFPASQPAAPPTIALIEKALQHNFCLTIAYCALGQLEPKQHKIEPHWLEQRGSLYYLHGYSYRAEATLILRLDRMQQIRLVQSFGHAQSLPRVCRGDKP